VLFQHGALFSSLTALLNVQFSIREYLKLTQDREKGRTYA
jgi:ABC-type transporter Mla maintaining outer membrane lipid asymmetry ATPase subunit MlaF